MLAPPVSSSTVSHFSSSPASSTTSFSSSSQDDEDFSSAIRLPFFSKGRPSLSNPPPTFSSSTSLGDGEEFPSVLPYTSEDLLSPSSLFDSWLQRFPKPYDSLYSSEERHRRLQIFTDNLHYIHTHNLREGRVSPSYWLGLNRFADLTNQEFKSLYFGDERRRSRNTIRRRRRRTNRSRNANEGFGGLLNAEVPSSIDWRQKGSVTEIKDQGSCGKSLPRSLSFSLIYF